VELTMNLFFVLILGCIGYGISAIVNKSLPIGPRRKVIDAPAIGLGITLIILPFANTAIILVFRWIATVYFTNSLMIDHWSFTAALVAFPLSIALSLTLANRWSVPKQYNGRWKVYVPYQRNEHKPDLSFLKASGRDS
jgi:hypothetical protein